MSDPYISQIKQELVRIESAVNKLGKHITKEATLNKPGTEVKALEQCAMNIRVIVNKMIEDARETHERLFEPFPEPY